MDYFINLATNDDGNKNMKEYKSAFKDDQEQVRIAELQEEEECIFNGASPIHIEILHSPKHIGNTRSCPSQNGMCLVGLGEEATPVKLAIKDSMQKLSVNVQETANTVLQRAPQMPWLELTLRVDPSMSAFP